MAVDWVDSSVARAVQGKSAAVISVEQYLLHLEVWMRVERPWGLSVQGWAAREVVAHPGDASLPALAPFSVRPETLEVVAQVGPLFAGVSAPMSARSACVDL